MGTEWACGNASLTCMSQGRASGVAPASPAPLQPFQAWPISDCVRQPSAIAVSCVGSTNTPRLFITNIGTGCRMALVAE